jgi:hypothetical protein
MFLNNLSSSLSLLYDLLPVDRVALVSQEASEQRLVVRSAYPLGNGRDHE